LPVYDAERTIVTTAEYGPIVAEGSSMIMRNLLLALLLAAVPALAANEVTSVPTLENDSAAQFLAYHDDVARKVETREFEALSRTERDRLLAAQTRIRATLAGKVLISELDEKGRLALFNANEEVVALVNKAEDERLVCKQTKRLGSHRHSLECRTVAQIRAERDAARDRGLRYRESPL
jgi:hypothetical protein